MAQDIGKQRRDAGRIRRHFRLPAIVLFAGLLAYAVLAYFLIPAFWKMEALHVPDTGDRTITQTGDRLPGDPLNVALSGTKEQVEAIMKAAGWVAADPLGAKSDERIVADTLLGRPYATAPVSDLYLFGRRQDLAFEQPSGADPDKRHHVRFWQMPETDAHGRPVWIGAASYDRGVGLSHETGKITHHIDADVDAERGHLAEDLRHTGMLTDDSTVPEFHTVRTGRNGGGDPWQTDGALWMGVIGAEPGQPSQ